MSWSYDLTLLLQPIADADDATHANRADNVGLAGLEVSLAVADSTHAHASDSGTLTFNERLGPWSYDLTMLTVPALSVSDARHYPHVVDDISLNASLTTLVVQDATHAHTADSATLVTWIVLESSESGTTYADTYALVWGQTYIYRVTDACGNFVTSNEVTFYGLPMYGAKHAQSADNLTLSDRPTLVVAECTHAQAADNVTLEGLAYAGTADDATHAHTADNLTLAGLAYPLAVQDATHAHASESGTLTSRAALVAQDARHVLSSHHIVWLPTPYPAESTHAHRADNVTLGYVTAAILVDDAFHGILADNADLAFKAALTVADAAHAQGADSVLIATASHGVQRVTGRGSTGASSAGRGSSVASETGVSSNVGTTSGKLGVY